MSILERPEGHRSSSTEIDYYETMALSGLVSVDAEGDVREGRAFVSRYVQWVALKSSLFYSDLLRQS